MSDTKNPCMECDKHGVDIYCHSTCDHYQKFRTKVELSNQRRKESKKPMTKAHYDGRLKSLKGKP